MMRVAIVTPYYREPLKWLQKCHESVLAQEYPTTHIMVADGFPREEVARWCTRHIVLPERHGDYGDAAKTIGGVDAVGAGFDAIGFLDADNWLRPDHVRTCVEAARESGASFVSTKRFLCGMDEQLLGICDNSDGDEFVDTNVMFFLREAYEMIYSWSRLLPHQHAICDRVVWQAIKDGPYRRTHVARPTVCYRVSQPTIYRELGLPVPESADHDEAPVAAALERWARETGSPLDFQLKVRRL